MSDRVAIRLSEVGKLYRLYPDRVTRLLFTFGWNRVWSMRNVRELWALRGIDLEVRAGRRLGIIGRNGAGKTTLLRLITGNVAPTEGSVSVDGSVQALLDVGAGFHPEFTGVENVRASLAYAGLSNSEVEEALQEVAEFTELGGFLEQPFKTYSAGMQARLTFATATVLRPDILIVDEILGAGDAYFAGKSAERMRKLVEQSNASVLLVSHSLDQILRYCEECAWLERGRIVMRGPAMEVVNAYQGFIHGLEERRLRAKNRRSRGPTEPLGGALETLRLSFQLEAPGEAACDVSEIELLCNGTPEESLRVGDVQDSAAGHLSQLLLEGAAWSQPRREKGFGYYRRLTVGPGRPAARGGVVFRSYGFFPGDAHELRLRYRCPVPAVLRLSAEIDGRSVLDGVSVPPAGEWSPALIDLAGLGGGGTEGAARVLDRITAAGPVRWPGEGSIVIESGVLLGGDGGECTLVKAGNPLTLRMVVQATRAGRFQLVPGATLSRPDGVFVSNFVGAPLPLALAAGERRELDLDLGPILLGNGRFVFSLSLFEAQVDGDHRYDLIARGYEFEVVGNQPLAAAAVFQHPFEWRLRPAQG